jgi:hypothetical protein
MSVTDFDIIDFIETYAIPGLKGTAAITSITDNLDGSYTIGTADTDSLAVGDAVTLSSINAQFNNDFEVSAVVANTSFTINKVADSNEALSATVTGYTIPALSGATWIDKNPRFFHNRIDILNVEEVKEQAGHLKRFPQVLLLEGLIRRYEREDIPKYYHFSLENAQFAFVDLKDEEWTRTQWETNIFQPMRVMALEFFDNLEAFNTTKTNDIRNVSQFEEITLHDFQEIFLTDGQAFDYLIGGVYTEPINIQITNAGKICT